MSRSSISVHYILNSILVIFFLFKQKTAYEVRISDWSSDVCSSDLGAITAFPRSLSENLIGDGIRVNAVAPGPIWTPLNPSGGADKEKLAHFGENTPMGRPGQPNEVAPAFLFLACDAAS